MRKLLKFSFISILIFSFSGCGVYSFTGASISPEVKTVSIDFFPAYAPLAPPIAGQLFTEDLKDIFLSQTNLVIVQNDGDLHFEGSIIGYNTTPVAIQGNETAALTRITVTVKVKFTNQQEEEQSFETNFSRFEDYETSKDLSSVEEDLLNSINDQLVQDIFNKAVTNW
jgi:outer membrane lipopolysaccharide assembly protein LptE/RlpB